jgi:transposase
MLLYIGIDWGQSKHDACFMNEAGAPLARLSFAHTPDGFHKLDRTRQDLGLEAATCLVSIETAHHLLLDYLWGQGYTQVYVIPPNVVKSSRGRYSQSGARTDQSDAFLLADLLRTDRARLRLWKPDSLLTRQLRAQVSLITHLTLNSVRLTNRLRSVLLRYYPAALHVFSDIMTQIGLEFVRTYPTPSAAAALTFEEFKRFAAEQGYSHPKKLPACFARLQQLYPAADEETVLVFQDEAVQLASLLRNQVQAKCAAIRRLQELFWQHPDAAIFASLPGAGDLLAPALLAKFGDDRERHPSAASIQALAGTCPVTVSSGKRHIIRFRKACDREFRRLVQHWAIESVSESVWASAYWHQIRPRCGSDSHAYRCLANRWLAIAWAMWQKRQSYDEAYHLQQRALRSRPRVQASS